MSMTANKKLETLREIVRSGRSKEEAKQELISQGHSGEDFSDLWDKVQGELLSLIHISEPTRPY